MGGRGSKGKKKNALGDAEEQAAASGNVMGYPTSGTWESPRGAILTEVEKVDRAYLAKLYEAEERNAPTGTLRANTDAKTDRAFQLGYMKPAPKPRVNKIGPKSQVVKKAQAAVDKRSDYQKELDRRKKELDRLRGYSKGTA